MFFFAEEAIPYPGAKRIEQGRAGWLVGLDEGLRIFIRFSLKRGTAPFFHAHRDIYITLGGYHRAA